MSKYTKRLKSCETCEHEGDSSNEYCGTCGNDVTSNWSEAGWIKDEKIAQLLEVGNVWENKELLK